MLTVLSRSPNEITSYISVLQEKKKDKKNTKTKRGKESKNQIT